MCWRCQFGSCNVILFLSPCMVDAMIFASQNLQKCKFLKICQKQIWLYLIQEKSSFQTESCLRHSGKFNNSRQTFESIFINANSYSALILVEHILFTVDIIMVSAFPKHWFYDFLHISFQPLGMLFLNDAFHFFM